MNKLISILLALTIVGGVLAGCSGEAAADEPATTAGADAGDATE